MAAYPRTVAACILAVLLPAALAAADHPHVVLIVADDLGWNDVGYHGSEIRTPNIDKLAKSGVMLERFYAYPLCSPTRTALMTGRHPIELGVNGPFAPNAKEGLPLDEHLLPQAFSDAGYQTFMTGKWHLGLAHVKYFPQSRGFDHFYGHLGAAVDFYEHVLRGGLDWQRNGKSVREEGYTTDLITAEAVRLLRERDKNKPVLLYITYNAVHIPLQAPESYIDKYANIADEERRVLAAMTDAMDAGIGKVLTTLDDEGMTPDTLVLFMSDNGGGVGASNAPLRLGKGTVFEGGIRVPAAISWPGVLNGGSKSSQFITAHDWLPTLAAAAGIRVGNKKPLYGENLWPQIRDGETVARKDLLIGTRNSMALFHQEWKLIEVTLRGGEKRTFLFRINDDPNEQNNLAEDNQEIVRELSAKIEAFPRGRPVSGDAGGRRRRPGAGQRPGRGRGTQQGPPGLSVDRGGDPGGGPETREPYAEAAARN